MNIKLLRLYTKISAAYRLKPNKSQKYTLGWGSGEILKSLNVKLSIDVGRSPPPSKTRTPDSHFKILDARRVT